VVSSERYTRETVVQLIERLVEELSSGGEGWESTWNRTLVFTSLSRDVIASISGHDGLAGHLGSS
jgi:hypothetical protein